MNYTLQLHKLHKSLKQHGSPFGESIKFSNYRVLQLSKNYRQVSGNAVYRERVNTRNNAQFGRKRPNLTTRVLNLTCSVQFQLNGSQNFFLNTIIIMQQLIQGRSMEQRWDKKTYNPINPRNRQWRLTLTIDSKKDEDVETLKE